VVIQAPTVLSSSGSGTDATDFNTPIVAPDAGALLVLFVDNGTPTSGENDVPTLTDTIGLTWTLRDEATGYNGGFIRGSIWTAPAPDGDSGSIGIHFAHQQSSCHWHLIQVKGANNDDPVVQVGHSIFNTTQNPSFNLPNAPAASSLVFGFAIRNGTTAYTAGANHTILSSQNGNSGPAVGSDVEFDMAPAGQAIGFTTTSGAYKTLFGIEIAMGGEVAPPPTPTTATLIRKWKDVNTLSTNTVPITAPADLEVGQTLIISLSRVTGASAQPLTGVTGIGANVATIAAGPSVRASTMIADTIVIPITERILAGTVMTVNITSGSPSRKAFVCSVWEGLTGVVDATSGAAVANGSSATPSVTTTGPVSVSKVLVIGTFGTGVQAWTPDPGNTLVDSIATAVGTTDRQTVQQYRVDSAAGTKSSAGTLAASGGWAANVIAMRLADSAPGAPIANAGGDVIDKEPGESIDLSASASTASGAMTFVWEQMLGEPVDFVANGAELHIEEAPWTINGTTLVFRVTVTSGALSSIDEVSVTVLPSEGRILVNGVEVSLKTIQVG
jgi:hypothetical protein